MTPNQVWGLKPKLLIQTEFYPPYLTLTSRAACGSVEAEATERVLGAISSSFLRDQGGCVGWAAFCWRHGDSPTEETPSALSPECTLFTRKLFPHFTQEEAHVCLHISWYQQIKGQKLCSDRQHVRRVQGTNSLELEFSTFSQWCLQKSSQQHLQN